jgi:NAD(P)H-dependent FMN reductase
MTEPKLRIVTLLGTSRPGNYTSKALALVEDELQKDERIEVESFDPAGQRLAFPGESGDFPDADRLRATVEGATGVVLATPEYHGSFAAMAKLIVENLGFPSMLAGKPVALLGVAAGRIGAVKSLEQLRGVCSHVGALVLPGPVSVAGVQKAFDADGRCLDASVEKAVRGVATQLIGYVYDHVCPKFTLERMAREG